ncbi:hypothetical protein EB796_007227 [Bugula neritina]|uniref:PKHD1L1 n=1 Tax=Bugula neritina TaxID=10212 RepID=A0A7J7KA85_BUGNE|nr:hypothetical protein EB796_007227 [Bugula neritina]
MAKLCKAIFLYCVFINFTLCQSTQSTKPLISFGELQELKLDNYNLRTVEDIEPDQLESGGFLVGNQHSLAHISPSLRVNILAGKENETAFRNGPGYSAYFNIVQDLVQINNGSDIIIADLNNHCIRKVERGNGLYPYVSTFVGDCGRQGYVSDPVSPADARLTHPLKLLHIPEENIFYYLLDKVILKHNLTSGRSDKPMYKDLEFFTGAYTS